MDIRNHPKMMSLELAKAEPKAPLCDMTLTEVGDGDIIQVVQEPTYSGAFQSIMQGDVTKPMLFCTLEQIYGVIDITSVGGAGEDSSFFYRDFIQRLVTSYIGSTMIIPNPSEDGYGSVLGDMFGELKAHDGGFGTNSVTSDEISYMLKTYCDYNLVPDEHGKMLLKTDVLYLPIYRKDLFGAGNAFDTLPLTSRAVIRDVIDGVSFKTFIRIILRDMTELTLWYSADNLIIMG